jgi:hypothetical protein
VEALKSQQRRWATGSMQVARKLLPGIWRAPIGLGKKIEATLHLTHYSVAWWMLLLALIARPMVLVYSDGRLLYHCFWVVWIVIVISAIAPSLVYAYARYRLERRWSGFRSIPSMFVLGCGMCVNNSVAAARGLLIRGGEFVRTPKSGNMGTSKRTSQYVLQHNAMWIIELALGIYSLVSFVVYFNNYHRAFSVFLLIYAVGFLLIGWLSRPRRHPTTGAASSTQPLRTPGLSSPETAPAPSS